MASQANPEPLPSRLNGDTREYYVSGEHMDVDELKKRHQNQYTVKRVATPDDGMDRRTIVPHYPRPVEFHVSKIAHVTTNHGLNGILDEGFERSERSDVLWWGLVIGPEEIAEAEERYLEEVFPLQSREEEQENGHMEEEPFLPKFTTSPAFKDGSRYGNFRFTLPLNEVLQAYRELCGGQDPILRVWETVVYKQQIMYSVLVHCPDVDSYDNFPILGDNEEGVCAYRNGEIIWRAQAISKSHKFRLIENRHERQVSAECVNEEEYYVWDHVTLAFHIPDGKKLSFPTRERLLDSLTACRNGDWGLNELIGYRKAKVIVNEKKASG